MPWQDRVRNVFRPRPLADEIDEELQFHIESSRRANIASGMPPDEARRDAVRRFGNAALIRDRTRDADVVTLLDNLRQDTWFALRSLRRRPAFALVALLTMAVGIGATTAIFILVRSILLRPLPFPDPDALHVVSFSSPGPGWLYPGMPDRDYLAFRDANRTFESLATFAPAQATLTGAGEATRVSGAAVTTDFFRVLGVAPSAGRALGPEDEGPGREKVVLIAESLWRQRFGADPGLINGTVVLNATVLRVVGILPAGFSYPADATYWIPLTVRLDPRLSYTRPVIGRLAAAVTRDQAQADLDLFVRGLPRDPERPAHPVARVTALHDAIVGDVRLPLLVFGGAVALVLLIVCGNVANLLLMRAVSRRQEIATRLALGAGRGRLVRQLLTESVLLALVGGVAGAGVALLVGPTLLSVVPPGRLPQDIAVRADGWVLAFSAGLCVLTGALVGLAPILQTAREGQYVALREGTASATRRSHQVRQALVITQVALTLVLLVGAGLLMKSFLSLRAVPLGFTPDRVVAMTVDLPVARYPSAAEAALFHDRLLESLSRIPGVQSAGAVNWLPLGDMAIQGDVQAEDRRDLTEKYTAVKVAVSPDYFTTMGIRLLRGRPFTEVDRRGSLPVLIVSESVARRLWPAGDPVGKRMALTDRPTPDDWLTIVGVVEDVRQGGVTAAPAHAVYQPYMQVTNRFFVGYLTFVVRTDGDPDRTAPLMRAALARIDRDEAPQTVATLDAIVDRTVAEPKFQARVLALFSLVALLLASVGIYGVVASSVLERRFEIGVRMALGADGTSVVRLVLRRTMLLTAAGILIGLAGAIALGGVLETLLFNVRPIDAPTYAMGTAVLAAAALIAGLVPARRASRVDPLIALRAE